jgi:hypothetical protein
MSDAPMSAESREPLSELAGQMASLSEGEQLVIRAVRRWIQCLRQQTGEGLAIMRADLADALGRADGETAAGMVTRLSHVMHLFALGPIAIHWPCCTHVSRDERTIVAALAACQLRDFTGARDFGLLCLHQEGVPAFLDILSPFAVLLRRNAILLPQGASGERHAPSGYPYLRPDGATLH